MKKPKYKYENVICEKVVDGDTIDVIIDLGFGIKKKERLRLYRINAWEKRGKDKEKGLLAKEYVEKILFHTSFDNDIIRIETFKKGKFGRILANVYVNGKCLNDELVREGHGIYQDY